MNAHDYAAPLHFGSLIDAADLADETFRAAVRVELTGRGLDLRVDAVGDYVVVRDDAA